MKLKAANGNTLVLNGCLLIAVETVDGLYGLRNVYRGAKEVSFDELIRLATR